MVKKTIIVLVVLLLLFVFPEGCLCQSQSQYALIKRPVYYNPLIWKLTKNVSNSLWGRDLFGDLASTAQSYVMSPPPLYQLYSGMSFHLDNAWNRMLFQECLDNWIFSFGESGTGNGQFLWPSRLDAHAPCSFAGYDTLYFIYIADVANDRIVKLSWDWFDYEMAWLGTITGGGLDEPQDLDINNGGTFLPNSDDYLWVLNGQQIKRFTMDGVLRKTYGTYACDPNGVGNFCRPSAVVCGRSPWLQPPNDQFANDTWIYVADAGNSRLVTLIKWTGSEDIYWYKTLQAPECQFFADLEVDNFEQVWAVDRTNSRIYKYTFDLYPLCYFGSFGTGDNQFYYPQSFSNTGGYLGCGNSFVAESWTDNSGGQYFAIGTDILDFEVTSSVDYRWHYINYTLIDVSDDTIKIYNKNNQLVKTLYGGMELSGACTHVWDGTNQSGQQVATGDYRVVVTDSSIYGDIENGWRRINGVVKQDWVHHASSSLTPPSSLVAYQTGPDKITLEWECPTYPLQSFLIYCDGCLCGAVGTLARTYTDSGLIPGHPYVYWVTNYSRFSGGGESYPSNADTVTLSSKLLFPSTTNIFQADQSYTDFTSSSRMPDTCDLEVLYHSAYPSHHGEVEVRLKNPMLLYGFNFLFKLSNLNVIDFSTSNISNDSIMIGSNWVYYPVRECVFDTVGSLVSRRNFHPLMCRGQVGDTDLSLCKYLWVQSWAKDSIITPWPNYRTLFKLGVDAYCIPDSTTDRTAYFYLTFGCWYDTMGQSTPFRYHLGGLTVWWSVPGDANADSLVNLGDVTFLISYVFKNGHPPCIPEAGDANGDCSVNLGDVVHLITYLYKGGPPPVPGCWHGKD